MNFVVVLRRSVQHPSLELFSWLKRMLKWYVVIFCRLCKRFETVLSVSRPVTDCTRFVHDFHICHWWSSKQVCRVTKPEPTFTNSWLARRSRTVQCNRQNFSSASLQHAHNQISHLEYGGSGLIRNVATINRYMVRKPKRTPLFLVVNWHLVAFSINAFEDLTLLCCVFM